MDYLDELDKEILSLTNAYIDLVPRNEQNSKLFTKLLSNFKDEKLLVSELFQSWCVR